MFFVVAARAASDAPVVLILGDSLSAGYGIDRESAWPVLLQQRLATFSHPHRVVNASVSGETTAGGRRRLPGLLARHQPDIVIVELGANDGLRGTRLGIIRANLAALVDLIHREEARAVVTKMLLPPNLGPAYTEEFSDLYDDLAESHGAVVTPFLLASVAGVAGLMQTDGLHPTAAAQARILDNVWPAIESVLAARRSAGVIE